MLATHVRLQTDIRTHLAAVPGAITLAQLVLRSVEALGRTGVAITVDVVCPV